MATCRRDRGHQVTRSLGSEEQRGGEEEEEEEEKQAGSDVRLEKLGHAKTGMRVGPEPFLPAVAGAGTDYLSSSAPPFPCATGCITERLPYHFRKGARQLIVGLAPRAGTRPKAWAGNVQSVCKYPSSLASSSKIFNAQSAPAAGTGSSMESLPPIYSTATDLKKGYSPPWEDLSIIGIAGSSGSGKTSVAMEIIRSLNLPWVVILVMDSFYKSLDAEQHERAHRNEHDFDCPESLDFDVLVQTLRDLKQGKKANIPVYSFKEHQRQKETTPLYSPRVLILEGILALHDPRILDLLDAKIFVEADMDVCLGRRIIRDVRERGRDVEGIIKQWFTYVKPSYTKYVEPQRHISDIIIPRGIENKTAIAMVVEHIRRRLQEKSEKHTADLKKLQALAAEKDLSPNIIIVNETPQLLGMHTILQDPSTEQVDFVFYFDRLASLLIERALDFTEYISTAVETPHNTKYHGIHPSGTISAVAILRGGSCMETALKRTIPDCITGRILIQTNTQLLEPELHYLKLPPAIETHSTVMLLDPQMASGGAALMAVRVLIDHGVEEQNIVFVTCAAGKCGLQRLTAVYPEVKVVVGRIENEDEPRWLENKYFGC
ncbi:uridine kinase [Talaromyces islandicus]|uniref:Uridine kinase n=1 Tax=Talaromyces islandicus TaxID=28573 RepID=A0A0U1M6C4_TALIS|nr:uridine kinase [Talaromyces islandicus]